MLLDNGRPELRTNLTLVTVHEIGRRTETVIARTRTARWLKGSEERCLYFFEMSGLPTGVN